MNNFRDRMKKSGYDSEEAYFHERDQELIKQLRAERVKESKLKLLPGGKSEDIKKLPQGLSRKVSKQAA